jgi:hypothetical protein
MTDQETKSKKDTVSKDQVAKAAAQLETEAAEMAVEGAAEIADAADTLEEAQTVAAVGRAAEAAGQTQQIRWRKPKQ